MSTAAASAASTTEFFARLDQAGVLVRLRYSTRNPGQVTGYAVALPGDTTGNGDPVWYGGGNGGRFHITQADARNAPARLWLLADQARLLMLIWDRVIEVRLPAVLGPLERPVIIGDLSSGGCSRNTRCAG